MSCLKIELIIFYAWQAYVWNQKIKRKHELAVLFTAIYNNENEG